MTEKGASIAEHYARGGAAARPFFRGHLRDPEARAAALTAAGQAGLDPAAARALESQNSGPRATSARVEHLRALVRGDAVAVVTGQQPGLFVGPLFGFLKTATAIALARRLERESGVRCVPILWVHDEDHDFREVASHAWLAPGGRLRETRLPGDESARTSLAHIGLRGVDEALRELAGDLDAAPHGKEVARVMGRHYRPERGIAEAYASALAELFGEEGLLTFRPRTPEVAEALAPLHLRCVDEAAEIETLLRKRSTALEAAGFGPRVGVRPGASLSFYHPDGPEGDRFRILCEGGAVTLSGSEHALARADLDAAARGDPLRFGASALLRPLAQDRLLPTAAYVAGPSELAYLAQLEPLYEHFDRPMPIVAPRLRLLWMDRESHRILGDTPRDAENLADDAPLARALASRFSGEEALDLTSLESRLHAALERELGGARPALAALDPNLGKACDRTLDSAARGVDKLVRKATRVSLGRLPEARARLEALRNLLVPHGEPQERVLGWTTLAAHLGLEPLRRVCTAADPLALDLGVRELIE